MEEVFQLVEMCYLRREHPYPNAGEELRQQTRESGYQLENHRIVEREGQIVAHAITLFHDITYSSAFVPAGSVGSVVSHPDYRGQHLGQKGLARLNPEEAGETVVILDEIFPPTHPFHYLTGR
ncbi:MAG: GNAT family N-acetyltransferase [Dehalococcoidia bacterium]|nr:GNAT family N-acetyltransferase [Dehalococcoidia bacterium]